LKKENPVAPRAPPNPTRLEITKVQHPNEITTYTIDSDNNIIAFPTQDHAEAAIGAGAQPFASQKDLAKVTAEWPISRLIETWNSFAGVPPFGDLKPVKKFTDRKTATTRIWVAIQKLQPAPEAATPEPQAAPKPAKKGKAAKALKAAKGTKTPREGTAKARVIAMLQRKGGAALEEIVSATGWEKHTVRGFISTLPKKTGIAITSTRRESDKARVYEAAK
jgi:Protein of unknown function (DUF3489)